MLNAGSDIADTPSAIEDVPNHDNLVQRQALVVDLTRLLISDQCLDFRILSLTLARARIRLMALRAVRWSRGCNLSQCHQLRNNLPVLVLNLLPLQIDHLLDGSKW